VGIPKNWFFDLNCSNPLSQNSKLLDDYDFNDQI
jgi:hypothetical protein